MPMEFVTELPYDHPYRWDGTLFGGPKLWRPSDIGSPLALWLDAEDTSTITLNGSTVSQWNDKSGNARNATQATAANQPGYDVTGLNGKPVISQVDTPTATYLSIPFSASSNYSVIYLANYVSGAGRVLGGSSNWLFGWYSGNHTQMYSGVFNANQVNSGNKTAIHSCVVSSGVVTNISRDGSSITINNSTAGGFSSLSTNGFGSGAEPSTNNFAEIIATSSALSTLNRQKVEGYLAWKWKLQANLPVGHPYKSLPPTA